MLESSRLWCLFCAVVATACATPASQEARAPQIAPQPAVIAPAASAEEARALLAQAETDVQRARARRALWLKAWEELLDARKAAAANDFSATIRHARSASELAQLGLEQLAYPAVK
jgi:uncharacterized protein (DUF1697 family)